jgi:predicted alpha/beta hydrolase family esterase
MNKHNNFWKQRSFLFIWYDVIMKNAILLHGLPSKEEYYNTARPSASNAHWFSWLQNQLLVNNIQTHTPEVFKVYKAGWDDWVKEVERYDINENTTLVGHSMGGGFWVRYLSERPNLKVDKVILVAPWLNINHEDDITFFDFKLSSELLGQANEFVIFASDNDSENVKNSVDFLVSKYPKLKVKNFHDYGHFTFGSMKTEEFPELLAAITS